MSARLVGRILTGLLVLALAAAVVLGVLRLPAPSAAEGLGVSDVTVPPSPASLVCPGPLRLPDDEGRGDAAFDPVPVAPVTTVVAVGAQSGGGTLRPVAGGDAAGTLAEGAGAAVVRGVTAPLVLDAGPSAQEPPRVAAATGALVTAGDLRGLSAASCQEPTTDAWLVGGATDLSSRADLVLDNAGATPAQVQLTVFGPNGRVDLTGERYLVAPGEQEVVALGAVASEQRGVVVHVEAEGGRVSASVQDSALDGFSPAGTDLVVPGAAPARRQVVPGVRVATTSVDDPHAASLRLLAPGGAPTTATISLLGPNGVQALPGAQEVALEPGVVTDVPLGGLPGAAYTVVVDAARPVVAAVQVSRVGTVGAQGGAAVVERAWAASVAAGGGLAALPDGTTGWLVLGAVGDRAPDEGAARTVTVRVRGDAGQVLGERAVELAAGRSVQLAVGDLAPGRPVRAVEVTGADGVVWALEASVARPDGTLVSVLLPVPDPLPPSAVAVVEDPRLGTG